MSKHLKAPDDTIAESYGAMPTSEGRVKIEGWINICEYSTTDGYFSSGIIYGTLDSAKLAATEDVLTQTFISTSYESGSEG